MYIVTRYVVWEVLKYFLATLVVLTMVVTPVIVVREAMKEGFPAMVTLRIMPMMLPEIMGLTIPASMLFAVCSVFGRMTGANEVVALKSLGISPMAVIWPAIVVASFLSLGTVCMYEISATWCKPNVLRIGAESIEEIAYSMLRNTQSYARREFSVLVKSVDGDRLIQPTITITGPPIVTLSFAEAKLLTDMQSRQLQIDCYRGYVDVQGQMRVSFPERFYYSVPLPTPTPDRYHRDWVATGDIPKLMAELQTSIARRQDVLQKIERLREAHKALGVEESPEDAARVDAKRGEIAVDEFNIRRLRAEPYRRWANGFTCLCFALIGTPVAMFWRHADVLTNFFVCFLPILAVYYPLLMFGDGLATSGTWPPVSFWTANVALATPAVGLLRWIVRH
jgi:lipopolysaccharide export system permease protein